MSEDLLEQLPRGWIVAALDDLVSILDNRRVPINSEERQKRLGEIPYYGATGQVGWIDDFLFDEELILLGEDGAPFFDRSKSVAYLIQGKAWVNNHAHVLRAIGGISNRFLMYQLNMVDYHSFVSGTTRMKLPQGPMKQIPLRVPPAAEQSRIVAEIEKQFTRLDVAVAALRRVQANLKRYRAAVLKAACEGRLVPTEAEMARKARRKYESAADILAHINRTEPNRKRFQTGFTGEKRPLPPLPEGWEWTTLVDIANIKGGITLGSKRRAGRSYRHVPYLRVANVQRGYLDLDEMKTVEASEEMIEQLSLKPGDVLFNEGGDRDKLGRGWIWNGEIKECIHQNHVFRARPYLAGIHPKYLSWYGNSFGQKYFNDEGKQTTNLASINLTKLGGLPIPLPPPAEQSRIIAEIERHLSVIDELETTMNANFKRADRLRQSILKRAFEGKLVPQDPADESAAALLERIRQQKATGEKPPRIPRAHPIPAAPTRGR